MSNNILITGGAGFIGSNFVHLLLSERPNWRLVCLDNLTYAGNLANLADCQGQKQFQFVMGDICDADLVDKLIGDNVDAVVNFAAESHVDRSILGCQEFIRTNIEGTQVLMDAARKHEVEKFVQVSTDEVYGSLGEEGAFTEQTPLAPNSPYSASKAAADMLVRAYYKTYGFAAITTRCSNNYGPYQFPEKLIPLFVTNLLADKKVPVYGDGLNVRDWIHVEDHCRAILAALEKGRAGEVYNIGSDNEKTNLEITHLLLKLLGKDESMLEYVEDRMGHDRRYAIDAAKAKNELEWQPQIDFAKGMAQTVQWYIDHQPWWQEIKTGEYLKYYKQQYGKTL
ncbi:MAG: dTDP-glucose 4,6-dehydratase [Sedimentisphaerales bacterium]|nr:dTDP-glucose 4,6-dehydratase [Sedimentisphaerales bacterium]